MARRRTEAERLTVQRIGQNLFRAALMDYWSDACLLRASYIRPWAARDSDAERLDAAFDAGLIVFINDGTLLASPAFTPADCAILDLQAHQ